MTTYHSSCIFFSSTNSLLLLKSTTIFRCTFMLYFHPFCFTPVLNFLVFGSMPFVLFELNVKRTCMLSSICLKLLGKSRTYANNPIYWLILINRILISEYIACLSYILGNKYLSIIRRWRSDIHYLKLLHKQFYE